MGRGVAPDRLPERRHRALHAGVDEERKPVALAGLEPAMDEKVDGESEDQHMEESLVDRLAGAEQRHLEVMPQLLAAQILGDLNDLAVHTPITAAAVYGGVGMAPQEHAFRSGVDVIIGTPGRLLDHFRAPYAKLAAYRERMGWNFKWLSASENDFAYDLHASHTPEEMAGEAWLNYKMAKPRPKGRCCRCC